MIGIAPDFPHVEARGAHHVGQILSADFNHQVRIGHLAPEFGLDQVTFESARDLMQGVHHQQMSADVGCIPVLLVREQYYARPIARQNVSDDFDGVRPMPRVLLAGFRVNSFQAWWTSGNQAETEVLSGALPITKTLLLPPLFG